MRAAADMVQRIADTAYILHKRNYSESSYIVDLFTRENGVVSVIAKGAKTAKSKFYLNLQLFSCLEVLYAGRTELMTLIDVGVKYAPLLQEQKPVFCGYYINELLVRLLHKHDQHEALFDCYDSLLRQLSRAENPEPLLRLFEKDLLAEIGYGIDFAATTSGAPIIEDQYYTVSPDEGVVSAASTQKSDLLVHGKTLLGFETGSFDDKVSLSESKHLMRRLLQHHLGGKPLKSRDLFAQVAGE
jgi:DNA repair protein RecO (recombination protein O)